jgi:hypothetical protein
VVVLAQEAAALADHAFIGPDHILLGVLAHEDGAGYRLLGHRCPWPTSATW